MPSVLDRYFQRRSGKLTKEQYEAGKHIEHLNNSAGLHASSTELRERVQSSVQAKDFDNKIISKLTYVQQLNEIRDYVGPLCWGVLYRVCIMDERIGGRFQNDLLRESLQLVYEKFVR